MFAILCYPALVLFKQSNCIEWIIVFYIYCHWPIYSFSGNPVTCFQTSCKSISLPVDRKYQKGQSRDNYTIVLYLVNIKKNILAFYWLRFVMWFYFTFHGMTTKSSKEVIIYHVILHWPVDIDRLKKLKWRPINPVSIEIWNSIQLLHFIEYIQQYFSYVVVVSYIGGGGRRTRRKPPTCRK